ncbi:MAG: hypothetical protein NVS9B15_10390 [Acidobacteriaceae bacterium]
MVFLYFLAAAWVAFVFAICVGDFFDFDFNSLRPRDWYQSESMEKPKAKGIAA